MSYLTVNAGSSSLKIAVFTDHQSLDPQLSVAVEGIGTDKAVLLSLTEDYAKAIPVAIDAPSHEIAAQNVANWLAAEQHIPAEDITIIGYRFVHGGLKFRDATLINDDVVTEITAITDLAPNHTPAALATLSVFRTAFSQATHVACFDTAFYKNLPRIATLLPLPIDLQKELGIQRFGFHGLSYQSLLQSFRAHEGEAAANGRVIMAHLGSGASVTALKNGEPVDTSMGFTPVSGIMMSTRTGDIEPGVITYIEKQKNLSPDEMSHITSHQSGLLGVSGLSADMHTLLQNQQENSQAADAIELFCYTIKKQIGAYASILGGIDSIVFSGGIGERSDEIRARVCAGLEYLGVSIDTDRNQAQQRLISSDQSGVGVHVIQAREDTSIIQQAYEITQRKVAE